MGGDHCGHQVFCFLITQETQSGDSRLGSVLVGRHPGAALGWGSAGHARPAWLPALTGYRKVKRETLTLTPQSDYPGVAFRLLTLPPGDRKKVQRSHSTPPSGITAVPTGTIFLHIPRVAGTCAVCPPKHAYENVRSSHKAGATLHRNVHRPQTVCGQAPEHHTAMKSPRCSAQHG